MSGIIRIEHEIQGGQHRSVFAPSYGMRGALTYKGRDKVQCHICGKYFAALGLHVRFTHEMSANDYRFEFGLSGHVGLVSEYLHERYQQGNGQRLKAYAVEANAKAQMAHQELWSDVEWAEKQASRSSIRQGGRGIAIKICVICGKEFRIELKSSTRRSTCSSACSSVRRAQQMRGKRWSADAKAAMSLKRLGARIDVNCKICGKAFQTSRDGTRPRKTCGSDACVRETSRRYHLGRQLSDDAKSRIAALARSRWNDEQMKRLREARQLESSKLWQFKKALGGRACWRREDVASLCAVSLNHATAMLSICVKQGALRRLDRGVYAQ